MKNKDELFEINKNEFDELSYQMGKRVLENPKTSEKLIIDYVNMFLRNGLIDKKDLFIIFKKLINMESHEVLNKYYVTKDYIKLRVKTRNNREIFDIWKKSDWEE